MFTPEYKTEYLIIVEITAHWPKQNEYDMPEFGIVVEIIDSDIPYPEEFIYQFNARALDADDLRWAGTTSDEPVKGRLVRLHPIISDPY